MWGLPQLIIYKSTAAANVAGKFTKSQALNLQNANTS